MKYERLKGLNPEETLWEIRDYESNFNVEDIVEIKYHFPIPELHLGYDWTPSMDSFVGLSAKIKQIYISSAGIKYAKLDVDGEKWSWRLISLKMLRKSVFSDIWSKFDHEVSDILKNIGVSAS